MRMQEETVLDKLNTNCFWACFALENMKKNGSIKKFPQETWIEFIWMTKKRFGTKSSMALWEEAKTRQHWGSLKYFSSRSSLYSSSFCLLLTKQEKFRRHVKARKKTLAGGGASPLAQFFFFSPSHPMHLHATYASPAWLKGNGNNSGGNPHRFPPFYENWSDFS